MKERRKTNNNKVEDTREFYELVPERFPKRLDAAAIRKLLLDRLAATTEVERKSAQYAWLLLENAFRKIVAQYVSLVDAPSLLAEWRRRNGDDSAAPRDYDCRCPVTYNDGIPECDGRRPGCKFNGAPRDPLLPAVPVDNARRSVETYRCRAYETYVLGSHNPYLIAAMLALCERKLGRARRRLARFDSGNPAMTADV